MDDEDDEEKEFPFFGDSQSDYDTVSIFNTHLCFFLELNMAIVYLIRFSVHLTGSAHILWLLAELLHSKKLCLERRI